jgi:hypothetical protein
LNANSIQNTIRVNEENEEIIVSLEILCINLVNKLESLLLSTSFPAMYKSRNSDTTASVNNIDTPRVRIQSQGNSELLNGIKVQFVFLVAIKGEKYVHARRRVFAVDNGINCSEKNLWYFLVTRHDNDDFWCRMLVQYVLYPFISADIVCNELVDAKEARDRQ